MLNSKFKIAVDVMTAEVGLSSAIRAVVDTLRKYNDIGIYVVGDQLMIEEVLESSHRAYWRELKLEIVACDQVIDQEDDPGDEREHHARRRGVHGLGRHRGG